MDYCQGSQLAVADVVRAVVPQRENTIASFHIGTGALEYVSAFEGDVLNVGSFCVGDRRQRRLSGLRDASQFGRMGA